VTNDPNPAGRAAVIIPCYNDGATLLDALASAQRERPGEIVVVNDGSSDRDTLRVLTDVEADGTKVINQANAGLAAARMAGVQATTSPYVAPLDADDVYEPGALTDLSTALHEQADAAVAYGNYRLFGTVSGERRGGGWDPWTICYVNRVPGGGVLIRRDALVAAGGWTLESGYEDWDLWMSMLERGESAVHVPRSTFRYRQGDGRMLTGTKNRHQELLARLTARHQALFAARRANWRQSGAPAHARILLPLVAGLPVGTNLRHRLTVALYDPKAALQSHLGRRQPAEVCSQAPAGAVSTARRSAVPSASGGRR
jgi:glycosyltransferase involved in cell wall biosynthesis